jgi:dTDP-4-amino-4,6-dideoxygalactose transaminase
MIARRRTIRARYRALVADVPGVSVFQDEPDAEDNCWLTALLVDPDRAPAKAADLMDGLETLDIEARPLWNPMHRQPVFADAPAYLSGVSDRLFAHGVTLPSGSVHDDATIERVCSAVLEVLGVAP